MLTNMYTTTYKRNHGPDRVKELSSMIDVHHDQFLAATTFDQKAEALRLMRGYAAEFLYQVPHDFKFRLKETERVLSQSVASIADFDPREASLAFENLALYAHNLLEQPWRKEFHRLKLTSGYWYHNIKAHLQNAHEMLITLGYVGTDDYTLELTRSADPLILKGLSRDCYMASQECLILSQIWERVQREIPDYPLTVFEAYETRKQLVGDADAIVRHLLYEARERQHKAREDSEIKQRLARLQQLETEQKLSKRAQNHVEAKRASHGFVPVDRLIDVDDERTETERDIVTRVLKNTEKQNELKHRKLYSTATRAADDRLNSSSSVSGISIGSDSSLRELGEVYYESCLNQSPREESRCDSTGIKELLERHKENVTKVDSFTSCRQRKESTGARSSAKPDQFGRIYDTPPPIQPTLYSAQSREDVKVNAGDVRSRINGYEAEEDSYSMLHDAPTMLLEPPHRSSYLDAVSPKTYEAPSHMSTSSSFKSLKHHQDLPKLTSTSTQQPATNGGSSSGFLSKVSGLMGIGARSDKTEKSTSSSASSTSEREPGRSMALSKSKVPVENEMKFESDFDPGCYANHNFPPLMSSSIPLDKLFLDDSDTPDESRNRALSSKTHYEKEVLNLNTNAVYVKQARDKDIGIPGPSEGIAQSPGLRFKVEPWDCPHCTFRNELHAKICEICSKTKDLIVETAHEVTVDLNFSDFDSSLVKDNLNASGEWTEVKTTKEKKNGKSKVQGQGQSASSSVRSYPSSYYPTKVTTLNETESKGKAKTNGYSSSGNGSRETNHPSVQCPQCTLLNPARNTHCEACRHRLAYPEYEGTLT